MAKLHDMQAIYAQELRDVCGIVPDVILLEWVLRALGPLALAPKSAQISAEDDLGLNKAVTSFMVRHHLPIAPAPSRCRRLFDCTKFWSAWASLDPVIVQGLRAWLLQKPTGSASVNP